MLNLENAVPRLVSVTFASSMSGACLLGARVILQNIIRRALCRFVCSTSARSMSATPRPARQKQCPLRLHLDCLSLRQTCVRARSRKAAHACKLLLMLLPTLQARVELLDLAHELSLHDEAAARLQLPHVSVRLDQAECDAKFKVHPILRLRVRPRSPADAGLRRSW